MESDASDAWVDVTGDESPASSSGRAAHGKPQRGADWVPVDCRVCGTRIYARPDEVGAKKKCPDCFAENVVRAVEKKPQRKQFASAGPDYRLSKEPVVEMPAVLRQLAVVECDHCGTEMELNASVLGTHVECRNCRKLFLAPIENERRLPTPHDELTPGVNPLGVRPLEASAEPSGGRWNEDDWLTLEDEGEPPRKPSEKAYDEALEEAKTRRMLEPALAETDDPPAFPFFSGVWTFPFYSEMRFTLLFLALMIVPIHFVASQVATLGAGSVEGGLDAAPQWIGVLFLVVFGGAWSGIVLVCMASNFLPVVQDTASGYDHIRNWLGGGVGEWIGATFYLFNSIFLSLVIGGCAYVVCESLGIGGAKFHGGLVALFAMLTHPFWLIALIDAGNPFVPWSPTMAGSLLRCKLAWMSFLTAAMPTSAVLILSLLAPSALKGSAQTAANWLAPVVTAAAAAIYFRLVGRIAWVSGQEETDRETERRELERRKKNNEDEEEDERMKRHQMAGVDGGAVPYSDEQEDAYDPFA